MPLLKSIIKPLRLLGFTAASSAVDTGIQKKILGSGITTLIISNKEMNDIMKIVQALESSGILLKGVTEAIKNDTKEQKGGFFSMLLGSLGASLLGNLLTGKGTVRAGEGTMRAGEGNKEKALMPPHPLTNFEIREDYKNQPRYNGVYSRDSLPKTIKSGAYTINLDEYVDVGTQWVALYAKNNEVIYFDGFGVEHIPKEIKRFIGQKSIKTNIFRIQAYKSIICGYFCIGFIDFMFANKTIIDFRFLACLSLCLRKN